MRCKNCGFDNEEGRYICQNCGSPLYDENDGFVDDETPDGNESRENYTNNTDESEDREKIKKSIIIIIVLCVILVALVAGIIFAAVSSHKNEEDTASVSSVSEITTDEETSTKKRTTTEKTTEKTTESTTEKTTEKETSSTTAAATYSVTVDIDGNGSVSGDGKYESGKRATLVATPDEGFEFEGWYNNNTGKLAASGKKYSVTVTENLNLTAKFKTVENTSQTEQNND